MLLVQPPLRAFAQFHDRVFLGVVLRSVLWAAIAFAVLAAATIWGTHAALARYGAWSWLASALGGIGAAVLTLFLFLPVATVIASLYIDRIANAVEAQFYPGLPPPHPASIATQTWDGIVLGLRVLGMQVLALLLSLFIPGLGFVLGWAIAAWAIGEGLFVAVAMRRTDRATAHALYRLRRGAVLAQGGLMTAGNLVPVLNLFIPVLGVAAMVHVLHLQEGR
jgi:uncharacterized protein involved in cysteine biosynthesis